MSFKVVIPARYGSTRLQGKPLLDICGAPMIERVYRAACLSDASEVIIATDDERIEKVAQSFSAKVCMTSAEHASGTDRLQEVVSQLSLADDEIVVNVQGDEPLMPAAIINQVAKNLFDNSWASISTLCHIVEDVDSVFNPNHVKAVMDEKGEALYFSRAPVPWDRDEMAKGREGLELKNYHRHIGIYAYRVSFLHEFVKWPVSHLEALESLEQLRALSHGHRIHIENSSTDVGPGVDTAEDLDLVRKLFS